MAIFPRCCTALFREDSGNGGENVPPAAQQRIDALTERTLLALDDARAFKPRTLYRWKHSRPTRWRCPARTRLESCASARAKTVVYVRWPTCGHFRDLETTSPSVCSEWSAAGGSLSRRLAPRSGAGVFSGMEQSVERVERNDCFSGVDY